MQSTGHSSTQALSLTSIQGSAITYAMSSLLRPKPYPREPSANPCSWHSSIASIPRMETTRTVSSLLDGQPVESASGGTLTIPDPAHLDETVAEACLGDADTFLDACRRAKAAQSGWASVPAPVRG